MASEKQHSISVVDEKRMEEAHDQLVDIWDSADQYPAPQASTQSFHHVLIFALFCSNIFFASLAIFFYSNAHCPVVPHRGDPFAITASHDARAHIRYEQRTFTGNLKYNTTTGHLYRSSVSSTTTNSSEVPQYVGDPRTTPGLDRAWKTLTGGSKFPLSSDETASYQHNTNKKSTGTVYAELDVFHSLDCLNAVRLALDDDFYREHGPQDGLGWQKSTRADREQLDYCIDHLRQSLQCSADLSVVPMVPRTSSNSAAADIAAQPRTCRKWDDVRSWVDRRQERSRFMMDQHQEQQRGSSV